MIRFVLRTLPFLAAVAVGLGVFLLHRRLDLEARYESLHSRAQTQERHADAYFLARRRVHLDPFDPDALYDLAIAAAADGRADQALSIMRSLATMDSLGHPPANVWLAERLLSSIDDVEAATAEEPSSVRARQEEAQALLERALKARPDYPAAQLALGNLYWSLGDGDRSVRHLGAVLDDYPETGQRLMWAFAMRRDEEEAKRAAEAAREHFSEVLEVRPTDAVARLSLADVYTFRGDLEQAEELLEEGLALQPTGPFAQALVRLYARWAGLLERVIAQRATPEAKQQLVRVANRCLELQTRLKERDIDTDPLLTAAMLERAERRADADDVLERAASDDPGYLFALAELHRSRSETDLARDYATRYLEHMQDPASWEGNVEAAARRVAIAATWAARYDVAVRLLEERVQANPSPAVRQQLALVYVQWWGDRTAASPADGTREDLLREAFRLTPDDTALVWAVVRIKQQSPELLNEATGLFSELLAEGKATAPLHLLLGEAAWQEGKKQAGLTHLKRAYELSPRSPEILNGLAWMLAHQDEPQPQEALDFATQGVALAPTAAYLRDTRGQIFAMLGRWEEALRDLETCPPQYRESEEHLAVLRKVYAKLGLLDEEQTNSSEPVGDTQQRPR